MWYRIELNKDRSVRSCVEVGTSINEGRSVHYVEADSKESAIAILARKYESISRKAAEARLAIRNSRRATNACVTCGKNPPRVGMADCGSCAALKRSASTRSLADSEVRVTRNKTDEAKALAVLRKAEATARSNKSRSESRAYYRDKQKPYVDCLRELDRDPVAAREWLVAKIRECQDKIDGKKTIAEILQPQAAE